MLISLHLPKTAGQSFFTSLSEYDDYRILRDYADFPMNASSLKRNGNAVIQCVLNGFRNYREYDCIYGHFLPLKYLLYSRKEKNVKFITWMRDPVERLASHYYFWISKDHPKNAHPLRRQIIKEKWSLERFCLSTELKNLYSQFLWGFPLEWFDFIGITEYYESEIEYFSKKFLGHSLNVHHRRVNPRKQPTSYFVDKPLLREKIIQYHREDMELYQKALQIWQTQRADKSLPLT